MNSSNEYFWNNWTVVHCGDQIKKNCGALGETQTAVREEDKQTQGLLKTLGSHNNFWNGDPAKVLLRSCPLSFYKSNSREVYLYELFYCPDDKIRRRTRFIYCVKQESPEKPEFISLDWTSTPIHNLNKQENLSLKSIEEAAGYLDFFCANLDGGEGTFNIIEPPNIAMAPDGKSFEAKDVKFLYAGKLFRAELSITQDGMVTMVSDEELSASETAPPLFELLESSKRYTLVSPDQVVSQVLLDYLCGDEEKRKKAKIEIMNKVPVLKVAGHLVATGVTFKESIYQLLEDVGVKKVEITGRIDFSRARFAMGLHLNKWGAGASLDLRGAIVEGHLTIKGDAKETSKFGPPDPEFESEDPPEAIDLRNITIKGDLRIENVAVDGKIDVQGANMSGSAGF